MTYDQLFKLCNTIALCSWIILVIAPHARWTQRILTGIIVTGFAVLYTWLVVTSFAQEPGGFESFSSLEGVRALFTDRKAVLTGWVHYLAFDLMTGIFIVNSARKHDINYLLILPCLFFTFMLGPIGLLLYFIVRAIKTQKYFHQYV